MIEWQDLHHSELSVSQLLKRAKSFDTVLNFF